MVAQVENVEIDASGCGGTTEPMMVYYEWLGLLQQPVSGSK